MGESTLHGLHVHSGCIPSPEPCGDDGGSSTGPESSVRTSVGATIRLSIVKLVGQGSPKRVSSHILVLDNPGGSRELWIGRDSV